MGICFGTLPMEVREEVLRNTESFRFLRENAGTEEESLAPLIELYARANPKAGQAREINYFCNLILIK